MPGLFTTLLVEDGAIRFAADHHARLVAGAARFGLAAPSPGAFRELVADAAAGRRRARVRVLLPEGGGVEAAAAAWAPPRAPWRLPVATASPPQDTVRWKTTARAHYDAARAAFPDAPDVLLAAVDGEVLEGCVTNVCFLLDGALVTPPRSAPLLSGIARNRVLAAARALGLAVREARLTLAECAAARACVATNALLVAHPVDVIDGVAAFDSTALARRLRDAVGPGSADPV